MNRRRRIRACVAAALVAVLTAMLAVPARAAPAGTGTAGLTVQQVLDRNPAARQVGPDQVEIAPGLILTVRSATGSRASVFGDCTYGYLCVWEHQLGGGAGLSFFYCQNYDLTRMRYPDGAFDKPGPRWNDRISSMINNQTGGTWSYFYQRTASGEWDDIFGTRAFDKRSNLAYDEGFDGRHMNDRIDMVDVC